MPHRPTKICGIYTIRRLGSDECYVGQSVDIMNRWAVHLTCLRKNRHPSPHMQAVFNKNSIGCLVMGILAEGFDPADKMLLTLAEQEWMDKIRPCYNTVPAAGSMFGFRQSEETRAKHSKNMTGNQFAKGKPGSRLGAKATPETCARISVSKKGKKTRPRGPMSEETKRKISETKLAQKTVSPLRGRKLPPDQIARQVATRMARTEPNANIGKRYSPERCANISAGRKGQPAWNKGLKKVPPAPIQETPL